MSSEGAFVSKDDDLTHTLQVHPLSEFLQGERDVAVGPRHLKYFASFENDMSKINVPVQAIRKQRFLCVRAKGVLWAQHAHSGEGWAEKLENVCALWAPPHRHKYACPF